MNDSGNSGYVSSDDFRDAIRQLGLPMTDSQTMSLAAKFAHGASRNRINYNEFLAFMNRAVPFLDLSSSMIDRTRLDNSMVDRGSFDFGERTGFGAPSPKERAQKHDLYTGMRRFRDTVLARGGGQDPTEVFVEFRGQEPTPAALLRARGIVSRAAAGE